MELDNNAHSVFLLYYHLVLVVKYRRQVFDETVSERSKEIFVYIAPKYNIMLQEWNYDKDHPTAVAEFGGVVFLGDVEETAAVRGADIDGVDA